MFIRITNDYTGTTEETTEEDLRNYEELVEDKICGKYGDINVYITEGGENKIELFELEKEEKEEEIIEDIGDIMEQIWESGDW